MLPHSLSEYTARTRLGGAAPGGDEELDGLSKHPDGADGGGPSSRPAAPRRPQDVQTRLEPVCVLAGWEQSLSQAAASTEP